MTPTMVKWRAKGVDEMGHCWSGEAKVLPQVALAIKVDGQDRKLSVQTTVLSWVDVLQINILKLITVS